MSRRAFLAIAAVFVAWAAMDYALHGVILASTYQETPELWRPTEQMKIGYWLFAILAAAAVFVAIYAQFFGEKCVRTGLLYGLMFGLGMGIAMGYGTYAVMPIPYRLAAAWVVGTLAEAAVAGLLVGWIVEKQAA